VAAEIRLLVAMIPLHAQLRDGTPVLLRPVSPADAPRLQAGLAVLSPDSRYFRFFGPVARLSDAQLEYFTHVDQRHHLAWLALDPATPEQRGLGIGRWVRQPEEPDVAELALTVIDAVQGRGLGTLLLAVLYRLAREQGVHRLRGVTLPENHRVTAWFQRLGAGAPHYHGGLAEFELPVVADPRRLSASPTAERFARLLEQLALEPEWAPGRQQEAVGT
jgi:GNAT superfamily N-acetyltransferase